MSIKNDFGNLDGTEKGLVVGLGCLAILLLVPLIWLISAVFVLVAWNLGVTNAVDAAGGHVENINLLTALGISFVIGVIGRIFRRPVANNS